MRRTLDRLHRDERGMSFVFVGLGFMSFLAATTLAIDVGMFMTARSQAQTSADAAALSGAISLAFDDYSNRSASGPAVQSALAGGRSNQVIARQVNILPADVTFPLSPSGVNNRVHTTVYRTNARGNAVSTIMGRYFGIARADVIASATAEASAANAMTCVKPFTIPDKWIERQTGSWDPGDTFDMYDSHNNPLANPDVYLPVHRQPVHGLQLADRQGPAAHHPGGDGKQHQPELLFLVCRGQPDRRQPLRVEHRQLQHDRDAIR